METPQTQPQPVSPAADPFAQSLVKENQAMKSNKLFLPLVVVVLVLGIGTGVAGATLTAPTASKPQSAVVTDKETTANTDTNAIKVGQTFGAKDTKAFKDPVEGVLVTGGIGSEGSHHLVRPGGDSQNVYLTSSIVDLKMFEGAKVKIWGETFKAQKAGWLMDVGRVEVEELNAPLPDGAKPAAATGKGDF
jgi:hypothetical protein